MFVTLLLVLLLGVMPETATAEEYPWHYALGGVWGLVAMIMAILAVLVAGYTPAWNFIRFVFGLPPLVSTLDDIRECLDWQFKTAMEQDKSLGQSPQFTARLKVVEERLEKQPYRPWYKWASSFQTPEPDPSSAADPPQSIRSPRHSLLRRRISHRRTLTPSSPLHPLRHHPLRQHPPPHQVPPQMRDLENGLSQAQVDALWDNMTQGHDFLAERAGEN